LAITTIWSESRQFQVRLVSRVRFERVDYASDAFDEDLRSLFLSGDGSAFEEDGERRRTGNNRGRKRKPGLYKAPARQAA
jgi:hypothetical protein